MQYDEAPARQIAGRFSWADADASFIDNPYPVYAALRQFDLSTHWRREIGS